MHLVLSIVLRHARSTLPCSALHARVAAITIDETLGIACATSRLEALHPATCARCPRSGRNGETRIDGGVTVQCQHVVWSPASWTATTRACQLHGDPQSLRARDLRAMLCVRLLSEVSCARIWRSHGLDRARCHKGGALRMFVQLHAGAVLWLPGAAPIRQDGCCRCQDREEHHGTRHHCQKCRINILR